LEAKIRLRLEVLPDKNEVKVLDCFSADGLLWREVAKRTNKKIKTLRLEKGNCSGVYLRGDNIKFLKGLNLNAFDVIDLDAYGTPSHQLRVIFDQKYKGIIVCTAIFSMMGEYHAFVKKDLGYTKNMIKKIPTLFNRNAFEKYKRWLGLNGVTKIRLIQRENGRKNYFSCVL